jgi:calcium-dependent protein kinase
VGIHKKTKQKRAIKIIPKEKVRDKQRFLIEIEILKNLDHPNICKMYESFEDERNVYIVMELCVGGELFDRIIETGIF